MLHDTKIYYATNNNAPYLLTHHNIQWYLG